MLKSMQHLYKNMKLIFNLILMLTKCHQALVIVALCVNHTNYKNY